MALRGRLRGRSPRATLCSGLPARSTGLQRPLPRGPGAGRGGEAPAAPGERSRASGRRRSGPRSLDGFRATAGPRGPVARGRAGWRRRSPSCAARLASAILDAAAAAASASSSVFAVRCWFLRPERRGGETGGCWRKRKKGVESVGDGARGQKAETERGGGETAPRPSPSPARCQPAPAAPVFPRPALRPPQRPCLAAPEGALPRQCLPFHSCPGIAAAGSPRSWLRRHLRLALPHPVRWPPPLPPPGSGPQQRQHGGCENLQ